MADSQFTDALTYFTDKICVPRVSSCVLFFAVIGEGDRVPRTWPNSFSFESFQQRCEKAYVSKDTNTLQCEPTWKTDARQLANTFSSLWLDGPWPKPAPNHINTVDSAKSWPVSLCACITASQSTPAAISIQVVSRLLSARASHHQDSHVYFTASHVM